MGVGSYLVNILKDEIIRRGDIPFYGTGLANYHSWNIALNEFEGETLSLNEINRIVRSKDYYITSMAADTLAEWERYIMWHRSRTAELLFIPAE